MSVIFHSACSQSAAGLWQGWSVRIDHQRLWSLPGFAPKVTLAWPSSLGKSAEVANFPAGIGKLSEKTSCALKCWGSEPSSITWQGGVEMTRQWFQSTKSDVVEELFEELIDQSSEEEHVAMLFNLLQNCLSMAARGAETGQGILQREGVVGAVAILTFLREHLRAEGSDPANGVFRRFYNAAHRQIIKAHQKEAITRFRDIGASIAKVIQKPYSSSFF
jgi:flagellin-specific chaperone FliS